MIMFLCIAQDHEFPFLSNPFFKRLQKFKYRFAMCNKVYPFLSLNRNSDQIRYKLSHFPCHKHDIAQIPLDFYTTFCNFVFLVTQKLQKNTNNNVGIRNAVNIFNIYLTVYHLKLDTTGRKHTPHPVINYQHATSIKYAKTFRQTSAGMQIEPRNYHGNDIDASTFQVSYKGASC